MLRSEEVKERLLREIAALAVGTRLPNRNALAERMGVARTTLERAIAEIIAMGYLQARDGSGTYVAAPPPSAENWSAQIPQHAPKEAKSWALLVNSIVHDIYPQLLRGVEDVAHAHDVNLIICNTDNSVEKQTEYLRKQALQGIDGIILVPAIRGDTDPGIFRTLAEKGIPVVCCNRPIPGFVTPGVYLNSFEMGLVGTRHLIDCGCRTIAYMGTCLYTGAFERYQGYVTALRLGGIEGARDWVSFEESYDYEHDGLPEARKILDSGIRFDGIFAFNDRIARFLYGLLRERGLEPGRDVQIVSCDNTSTAESLDPRLTSIAFPSYEMGVQCAKLLLDPPASRKPANYAYMSTVPCKVVVRASTRPPEGG